MIEFESEMMKEITTTASTHWVNQSRADHTVCGRTIKDEWALSGKSVCNVTINPQDIRPVPNSIIIIVGKDRVVAKGPVSCQKCKSRLAIEAWEIAHGIPKD